MSDKFQDLVTPICADWLNTVDQLVFEVFQKAETAEEARLAIDVPEEAPSDGYGYARKDKAWATMYDLPELQILTLYLGVHASPPLTGYNGQPLVEGMFYYDTTYSVGRVFTGVFWQALATPVYGATFASWVKTVVAAGAVTTTDAPDSGSSFALEVGATVHVYRNGLRLVPLDDFTVDTGTDTITFTSPQTGKVMVEQYIGSVSLLSQIANRWLMQIPEAADGSRTVFSMQDQGGTDLNVLADSHVEVFVDGHMQRPGIDYTAAGSVLTFTEAPLATSNLWGIWIDDDGDVAP